MAQHRRRPGAEHHPWTAAQGQGGRPRPPQARGRGYSGGRNFGGMYGGYYAGRYGGDYFPVSGARSGWWTGVSRMSGEPGTDPGPRGPRRRG